MKNNLRIKATGSLVVKVIDLEGKLLEQHVGSNLVVDIGIAALGLLLAGDPTALPIVKGSIGTSATLPAATDTAITGAFYKSISNITYPSNPEVKFEYVIGPGDANGMNIVEYGLHNSANDLYCRTTKPVIAKNPSFSLVCEWTVKFTAI